VIGPALQAMAEPRRREILLLVRDQAHTVGEIAARFDISRPAISQHLAVLNEAGLVTVETEGTRRYYRARPEGMAEVQEYIESFWTTRLAELKNVAEHRERTD
jgi:DNA-binding transcriptional ArsR family regulator